MNSQEILYPLDELLPGIPNDIVLEVIAPKLSWRDADRLYSVNSFGCQGIQSKIIYDARVRHHATETLVVFQVFNSDTSPPNSCFFLYSFKDETFHQLPPVPHRLSKYQYTTLDGKLYVLGGCSIGHHYQSVYVLDLAARGKQWKKCANMLEPRSVFGCSTLHGRIYVCGGASVNGWKTALSGSETYDPKVNAWFPVKSMLSARAYLEVSSTDEEIIAHGGYEGNFREGLPWQVYHPGRDDWRLVDPFKMSLAGTRIEMLSPFTWKGSLCAIHSNLISVYETEMASWADLTRISCDDLGPARDVEIEAITILPINNELVATVHWFRADTNTTEVVILRSKGFSSNNNEVVWSRVPHVFGARGLESFSTVQL